jgi:hypothetical protein
MILKGIIKLQQQIIADKQVCDGVVYVKDDTFRVLIRKRLDKTFMRLSETVFHELLHLGCFVISAITGSDSSERTQHQLIKAAMPKLLSSKALQVLRCKSVKKYTRKK